MIIKLFLASLLFYFSISCQENKLKKSVDDNHFNGLIDSLNSAMQDHDGKRIATSWNSIMREDSLMLVFLIDSIDRVPHKYIWYDSVHKHPSVRIYQDPKYSIGKLFLICAIAHNDLFFAFDQKIYDNSVIDSIPDLKNIAWNGKIYKSLSCVDYSKVWKSVYDWNNNGRMGRPFANTNYYWLGEEGGHLTFDNSFHWIIR